MKQHGRRRTAGSLPYHLEDRGYKTPCWIYDGYVHPKTGYGMAEGTTAQRAMYKKAKGPIPPRHDVDHLCRVRPCICPDHLEAVTRKENARRSPIMGRRHVLTLADKAVIASSGERLRVLAARYDVTPTRICQVRKEARCA